MAHEALLSVQARGPIIKTGGTRGINPVSRVSRGKVTTFAVDAALNIRGDHVKERKADGCRIASQRISDAFNLFSPHAQLDSQRLHGERFRGNMAPGHVADLFHRVSAGQDTHHGEEAAERLQGRLRLLVPAQVDLVDIHHVQTRGALQAGEAAARDLGHEQEFPDVVVAEPASGRHEGVEQVNNPDVLRHPAAQHDLHGISRHLGDDEVSVDDRGDMASSSVYMSKIPVGLYVQLEKRGGGVAHGQSLYDAYRRRHGAWGKGLDEGTLDEGIAVRVRTDGGQAEFRTTKCNSAEYGISDVGGQSPEMHGKCLSVWLS